MCTYLYVCTCVCVHVQHVHVCMYMYECVYTLYLYNYGHITVCTCVYVCTSTEGIVCKSSEIQLSWEEGRESNLGLWRWIVSVISNKKIYVFCK